MNSREPLAGIEACDCEAVIAEPGFDGGDVLVGGSELRAELIGGEPLVVAGRARRIGLLDEVAERGLLGGSALEVELQTIELHAVGRGPAVIGGVGEGIDGVSERDALAVVDGADDADGGCGVLCEGRCGTEA